MKCLWLCECSHDKISCANMKAAAAAATAIGNTSGKRMDRKKHVNSASCRQPCREKSAHTIGSGGNFPLSLPFSGLACISVTRKHIRYKILPLEWIYVYAENFFNFVSRFVFGNNFMIARVPTRTHTHSSSVSHSLWECAMCVRKLKTMYIQKRSSRHTDTRYTRSQPYLYEFLHAIEIACTHFVTLSMRSFNLIFN